MERDFVPVYLPGPLIDQVDVIARDELRSRANTVRWLLSDALQRRQADEPVEAP